MFRLQKPRRGLQQLTLLSDKNIGFWLSFVFISSVVISMLFFHYCHFIGCLFIVVIILFCQLMIRINLGGRSVKVAPRVAKACAARPVSLPLGSDTWMMIEEWCTRNADNDHGDIDVGKTKSSNRLKNMILLFESLIIVCQYCPYLIEAINRLEGACPSAPGPNI